MAAAIKRLTKSGPSISCQTLKSITTFAHLRQEAAATFVEQPQPSPPPAPPPPPLPEFRTQITRYNPISSSDSALIPVGSWFSDAPRVPSPAEALDADSLMNHFTDCITTQNWADIKQGFEFWVRSFDRNGRRNRTDVGLYNHYLRANLMTGASAAQLLDLVARMEEFGVVPNAASYNLVLKAMQGSTETTAAEKLIDRMLHTGKEHKESLPDGESYDIVINMLLSKKQIDAALKYIDMTLKSGYMLSTNTFTMCVTRYVTNRRLDALASVLEMCKKMNKDKNLCLPWKQCNSLADVAMLSDNSELTYYILEFFAKWIAVGERTRSRPIHRSTDEGLVVSSLATAGRTYSSKLLEGSWSLLKQSLRKNPPSPDSYIAKIYAHSSLGDLKNAFGTLFEFETAHGNSDKEGMEEMFSPFTSLNPLVVACSKQGFVSLDSVYCQLENLRQASTPYYKSVAALNCVILGCANIWDADRAYETFAAIDGTFGLSPDIHSYNALICAFGKLGKIDEAMKVYNHFLGLGVKPNATTYSSLIDAHLVKRDPKAALWVIDDMINEGFEPTKETLRKVRRRCIREMDYESDGKVEALAQRFKIQLGSEARRGLLFKLEYSTDDA